MTVPIYSLSAGHVGTAVLQTEKGTVFGWDFRALEKTGISFEDMRFESV